MCWLLINYTTSAPVKFWCCRCHTVIALCKKTDDEIVIRVARFDSMCHIENVYANSTRNFTVENHFVFFLHRLLGRRLHHQRLFQRTFIHDMNVFCMEMGNQSSTFRSEDAHKKWNEATTRWYICFATHLHRRVVIHLTISPWTSFVRSFVFYSTSNFKIINRILSAAHSHAHYTATYVTLRTMYLYIIIFDSVTIDRRAKRQRKPPRNQQKEENHIYIWIFVCRLDP